MPPTGLVARLKSIWGEKEPDLPQISPTTAILVLILYTLIYVLPLYASSTTRPSATLSRDAPSVIKGRIRSVTISTTLCALITFFSLVSLSNGNGSGSVLNALHVMGIYPIGIIATLKSLLLVAVLFVGPLFAGGIADGQWKGWLRLNGVRQCLGGWIGYRNYVAGPITEELLFRTSSVPLLLLSHTSHATTIFLTPIIFGLAHVHHFYEFRLTHPHVSLTTSILRSAIQFTYTTLFGGFATFVYLRTGSVLACTVVHTFCNWQGFPRFWGRIERSEEMLGAEDGKRDEDKTGGDEGELAVGWSVVYYILLAAGAWGFYKFLWVLTESEDALVQFS